MGICGRTGAGKSSLLAALLRLTPIASGRITVDGVDVAALPPQALRRAIGECRGVCWAVCVVAVACQPAGVP